MFPPLGGTMFDDRMMQQQLEVARLKSFRAMGNFVIPMDYEKDTIEYQTSPLALVTGGSGHDADLPEDDATSPSLGEAEEEDEDDLLSESEVSSKTKQLSVDARRKHGKVDLKSFMYDKKTFSCQHCKYITDRKNNLKRHIATMHEKCGKVLECCDVVFANKAVLREHVISNHRHGYDCRVCGRNFCRKALLKRHITVHSGQKDYVCQTCGYATSHKSNLDRHKKRHLPKESRASHRYPSLPHHHHLSLQLPKYPPADLLTIYREAYSDFLDGRLGNGGPLSPLRSNCGLHNELQFGSGHQRAYSDKGFFKKRLIYMFENGQTGITQGEHADMLADQNQNGLGHLDRQSESSDSGSESPRDPLPSRETDTTESPFVSPSNTDSPENSFEFPVFSSPETSPNSLDLSDADAAKSVRLFPRLHRCKKCERVFQTQLQLVSHVAHAHALNLWAEPRMLRPLTVQFRRKEKKARRLPAFLFA